MILAGSAFLYTSGQTETLPHDIDLWVLKEDHELWQIVIHQVFSESLVLDPRSFLIKRHSVLSLIIPRYLVKIQIILSQSRTP